MDYLWPILFWGSICNKIAANNNNNNNNCVLRDLKMEALMQLATTFQRFINAWNHVFCICTKFHISFG